MIGFHVDRLERERDFTLIGCKREREEKRRGGEGLPRGRGERVEGTEEKGGRLAVT